MLRDEGLVKRATLLAQALHFQRCVFIRMKPDGGVLEALIPPGSSAPAELSGLSKSREPLLWTASQADSAWGWGSLPVSFSAVCPLRPGGADEPHLGGGG